MKKKSPKTILQTKKNVKPIVKRKSPNPFDEEEIPTKTKKTTTASSIASDEEEVEKDFSGLDADGKKALRAHPSPDRDPRFVRYWNILLPEIAGRENFKLGHTLQLQKLCNLYVWSDELEKEIRESGVTYLSEGKNGVQQKTTPEVSQYNEVLRRIESYTKTLGLTLYKDKKTGRPKEKDEWD